MGEAFNFKNTSLKKIIIIALTHECIHVAMHPILLLLFTNESTGVPPRISEQISLALDVLPLTQFL